MGSHFDQIISMLDKKRGSEDLLNILMKIRKEVEWPINIDHIKKLQTRGYLRQLIQILQMTEKPIIDVTLSILGKCIMDRDSAREAIGTHHLTTLGHLLVRYPDEERVIGRVLSILANMLTHKDQWATVIINSIPKCVTFTVNLITTMSKDGISAEDSYSEDTVIKALRILRLLANSRTVVPLVETFGVLRTVGSFFIKLTMEWQETKNNEGLLYQIIKLFQDYSCFRSDSSIQELRNTERGDSFLYMCNLLLLHPKPIVAIIMNFRKSQFLHGLPIREICEKFIHEVTKQDQNIQEFKEEFIGYIKCLCQLLPTSSSDLFGQCIPLFIKVLEAFVDPSKAELESCVLIVATLNNSCQISDLVQCQMRCKVIRTLVDKLRWLRGAEKASPAVIMKHSMPRMKENSLIKEPKPADTDLKRDLIIGIAKLINVYAGVLPPLPELASEELIIELVNWSEHSVDTPSSAFSYDSILCKIMHSAVHLIPLMKTTVIAKIYSMKKYQHGPSCVKCEEGERLVKRIMCSFTEIAQAAVGKGDIAYALLRGSTELKEQLVLAIPYIVEQKSLLVSFFLHCDGLDVLVRLIKDGSPHKDRALEVLYILASKILRIVNPCHVPPTNVFDLKLMHLARHYKDTPLEERTVTFKLDDGSSVRTNRNLLTQRSEYFEVLLSGNFKESSEDEVALHNVESDTLRCILHLLKHTGRIEHLVVRRDIHTLLDAIVVADRYLLTELCNSLVNYVEKHRMTSETVASIYRWSHESGLNMLREECVSFALVQCFYDDARKTTLNDLFRLGCTDELVEDIQELLKRHLKSMSSGGAFESRLDALHKSRHTLKGREGVNKV